MLGTPHRTASYSDKPSDDAPNSYLAAVAPAVVGRPVQTELLP